MKRIKDIKSIIPAYKAGYKKELSFNNTSNPSFPNTKKGMDLLQRVSVCYDSLYSFRKNRRRDRKYYRGEQWSDMVEVNGKLIKEEEYIIQQGKPALKQNLIRPPIKNVLGQFRGNPYKSVVVSRNRDDQTASEMMSIALESVYEMNDGKERDVRQLEEFLISGSAIYITSYSYDTDRQRCIPKFRAIDINRFFQTPAAKDICGEDIDFIGDFIDITLEELISIYAKNKLEEQELRKIYAGKERLEAYSDQQLATSNNTNLDLLISQTPYLCRVIRICALEGSWKLYTHDYIDASFEIHDLEDLPIIQAENAARMQMAQENGIEIPLIEYKEKFIRQWNYYHISPYGNILFSAENPYEHKNHPYIVKFYPMLDGEAWSMVNDLIDQQRMINRMIILNDFIVSASAKGVLLVPEECIPDDMDIEDIAEEWTKYNGVIKIKLKPGATPPQQIVSNKIPVGVNDMINLQIKLMQDIGGVHSAIQGKAPSSGTPSSLYQQEAMNAQLNILDYLESFTWFLQKRDYKILQLIKQFFKEPQYLALAGKNYSKEARYYDPNKIKNIDFDNHISKSNDTASFRMVIDEMLKTLLEGNFITIEMFLEHCSYPFADKLLEAIKTQKEQIAEGKIPDPASLSALAQQAQEVIPSSSQQGIQTAKNLINGYKSA